MQEIVVTAQRRSENLQRVPIAVSAATAAKLETSGIAGTADIGQVTPGLQMSVSVGFVRPTLRGIGTTSNGPGIENPIAIYLDGVYLSSSTSSIMSLSNIDRIETLKGPQGTLVRSQRDRWPGPDRHQDALAHGARRYRGGVRQLRHRPDRRLFHRAGD